MKKLRLREDLQPAQIGTAAVSGHPSLPKAAITEQGPLLRDLTPHRVGPPLYLASNNSELTVSQICLQINWLS